MKKTTITQNVQNSDRRWLVIDAKEYRVGDLSVAIANALRGKDQPDFTPHSDMGAYVVVLNADKAQLSGDKEDSKLYYSHSGYLGHLKTQTARELREKKPTEILRQAISGMLTKTKNRKHQLRRLFLVEGEENPYQAQKPTPLVIK